MFGRWGERERERFPGKCKFSGKNEKEEVVTCSTLLHCMYLKLEKFSPYDSSNCHCQGCRLIATLPGLTHIRASFNSNVVVLVSQGF